MEQRWRGHWALAALVRAAVFALPLGASVAAGAATSRLLPRPVGWTGIVAWWVALLGIVTLVMVVVERLARRLLPLAALLKLSLIFPDQAPSRFRMAVRAGGTRKLEQRLKAASEEGLPDTPAEAARKVLELAALLNVHDRHTRGHSERVRVYADLLADELKLPAGERNRLHWAALLHDIGKLVVPGHILNKAGVPDEAEWEVLRRHPLEGERFIEPLRSWLGEWAAAIGEHHERYDGGGYPRGLAGQQISMAARIVAVADSYEVMTSSRAYKKPLPAPEARRELARCAGSQFDPNVVRAFLNISLGKLRLAMGPLAWLAQIPVVAHAPTLGSAASTVSSAAAGVAASTALVFGGVADVPSIELSPPAAATVTPVSGPAAPGGGPAASPEPVLAGGAGGTARTAAAGEPSTAETTDKPARPDEARREEAQEEPEPRPVDGETTRDTTGTDTSPASPIDTGPEPATVVDATPEPAEPAEPTTVPAPSVEPAPPTTEAPAPSKAPRAPTDSDADSDKGLGNDEGYSGPAADPVAKSAVESG